MREFSPFRRVLRLHRHLDEAQALADAVDLRAEFDQAWNAERARCLGGVLPPRDPRDVLRGVFQEIADQSPRGTDAPNA